MSKTQVWDSVSRDQWTYTTKDSFLSLFVYKIQALPDFTSPRFEYLSKDQDNRLVEVAKKQMQMIRQFHAMGTQWAISLRLIKEEAITLYLIFRYAGSNKLTEPEQRNAKEFIQNYLMRNEYRFEYSGAECLDASWVREAAEISRDEQEYQGDYFQGQPLHEFYVPYMWNAADNNMEYICQALVYYKGKAAVDITIQPSKYLEAEKNWMNGQISMLRESMNGETIRSEDGRRVLFQGKKIPTLKTPLDNSEKMNKQFEMSQVFLSSIRVFASGNVKSLADALLVNSVKNRGIQQIFQKGSAKFSYLLACFKLIEVSMDVHTGYWEKHSKDAPMRAQRLNRLVSLEEISNFFRIPIPIKAGFPGFGLDTGLDNFSGNKKIKSMIRLGNYLDVAGDKSEPAVFDSQQFAKHGLIVGVPGSGKTTAMFHILYQLWAVSDVQKIPFIILEPAKTEYRALKCLPEFKQDMLVFTLGDESVSPFRFNPMEVLPGIRLENHISRLQACFVGAFDLFDPLPIFLEQAIHRTYLEKGWYEDSRGGEDGLETPTLSDLCRNAEYIVSHSGFDAKMRSDFQASLLERLNSLRRGSKGRMLDTQFSIPMDDLMNSPIVLELDSLNGDEKALLMMFLLSYVYEYCKVKRKSGSPLRHMLLIEEAHNLISAQGQGGDNRANPKAQTIELFVNMLAEMRALGQGILIADQLPTAIAPQAVKQTNVKILMRVTAKDDREEIGNTMDLNEEQMHQVVNFKTGHAYLYHEGEDRVRMIRMVNFKGEHQAEEPPSDVELRELMKGYELSHGELYIPYEGCRLCCKVCDRRTRNQAEAFVRKLFAEPNSDPYKYTMKESDEAALRKYRRELSLCSICMLAAKREIERILERYKKIGHLFGGCVYVHMLNMAEERMLDCKKEYRKCSCKQEDKMRNLNKYLKLIADE